jgi:hypothetical protein
VEKTNDIVDQTDRSFDVAEPGGGSGAMLDYYNARLSRLEALVPGELEVRISRLEAAVLSNDAST